MAQTPHPDRLADVDPQQAAAMLEREEATLLDVREPQEWSAGHAPQAEHLPLGELDAGAIQPDRPVIAVCRSGNRSGKRNAVFAPASPIRRVSVARAATAFFGARTSAAAASAWNACSRARSSWLELPACAMRPVSSLLNCAASSTCLAYATPCTAATASTHARFVASACCSIWPATSNLACSKRRVSMRRASGAVSAVRKFRPSERSISMSPPARVRWYEKDGFRRRPACTRSAWAMPTSQ